MTVWTTGLSKSRFMRTRAPSSHSEVLRRRMPSVVVIQDCVQPVSTDLRAPRRGR